MRTLTAILVATTLGLSSTAFTAEPTARDTRMNEALKNYEAQKAGAPAQAKAAPMAKKQHGVTFLLLDIDSLAIEIRPIVNIAGQHQGNQISAHLSAFLRCVDWVRKTRAGRSRGIQCHLSTARELCVPWRNCSGA